MRFGEVAALLWLAMMINGCATLDPSKVEVALDPTSLNCSAPNKVNPVRLSVKNAGPGALRIGIDPRKEPPYQLSWLYYKVQNESIKGDHIDWRHGGGGHGPMPPMVLRIESGDAAQVLAPIYGLSPEDHSRKFRIQFTDEAKHTYFSEWFLPCP